MRQTLLKHLEKYLTGHETLKDVEAWVVGNLRELSRSEDTLLVEMVNNLDSDLVEFGEGILTEETLQDRIKAYYSSGLTIDQYYPMDISVPVISANSDTVSVEKDYSHSTTIYTNLVFS